MKYRHHFIQAPLATAIAALCTAGPALAVNLTLVDLGDLSGGNGYSTATGINAAGTVVGGAELRVSAGSTAVFFGPVLQRTGAVFSGTGAKLYEGGLSVGGSPGLGLDAGNVSFGTGNLYLADIGGLAAGTQFGRLE